MTPADAGVAPHVEDFRLIVGTRGPGRNHLHRLRFSVKSGRVCRDGEPAEAVNPSFGAFHPDGHVLYVVNENGRSRSDPAGSVSAFAIDKGTGALCLLNSLSSGGAAPCHVSIAPTGRHLFVANYWGGSIAAFAIAPDGSLDSQVAFVQHEGGTRDRGRDPGPHAHAIRLDPWGRHVVVADLGRDEILLYTYDATTGGLAAHEPAAFALAPGAGPRHFTFDRDGRHAFVINELNSTLDVLAYDAARGSFRPLQSLSTRASNAGGENAAAEVALSPDGRHLYASNRGDDTIAICEVDQDSGLLRRLAHQPSLGRKPRHFALDREGSHLVLANQGSDTIVVFARDPADGGLAPAAPPYAVPAPVWVGIAP
ncbi:MAG: lactonase family protein [Methylobacteriaceae bacterium]|nr:lactonase family protein [Methylobacteriaceae bacterium]